MKKIFETPTYCGSMKEWRVLNLLSGTVYSSSYDSWQEAWDSIEDGEERAGSVVKRVELIKIVSLLNEDIAKNSLL